MKVLITDHIHPILAEKLKQAGHLVDIFPDIETDEVKTIISQYDGLVISTKTIVDRDMIDKAKQLAFIARAGSGMEHIDSDYATQKGILVVSSPEGNANAVAEHAVGLLVSLVRNISVADWQVRKQGLWLREANRGIELSGRTIGIIGYGNTGAAFSAKLTGLGMRILVYDKYKRGFGSKNIREASLQQVKEEAEFISLHLPLTAETKNYLSEQFIKSMKTPFFLINTSRGKIVDLNSLISGLEQDKILGAALDVLPNEKLDSLNVSEREIFEKLCAFDNKVIISPHIAGWTEESKKRLATVLLDKLAAVIGGV